MKYRATVSVGGNASLIAKVFASEDRAIKGKASYRLRKSRGGVVFAFEAGDSVALRTVLNSVTKILNVVEKVGRI